MQTGATHSVDPDATGRGDTPLAGVRVLDFTRVLSGPHCTRMLADLGAEVIKVEPPDGDLTRFSAPRINSLSSYFIQQNTGKANISLDTRRPEAIAVLLDLVERCDVVVENFRPGVMERMGLGYETAAERNPRIVYASITGYGSTGPWVHRRAYAPVVGADTGLTKSQGDARDGRYTNDRHSHGDVYTSLEAASAILAALFQRERTGRGQWIDISMAQTLLYVNEHLHDELWDGDTDPNWLRSFRPGDCVVADAANGDTVIISGHPAERGTFELLMDAIGRADLRNDERLADVAGRLAHLDEIRDAIAEAVGTFDDGVSLEEHFAHYRIASGVLRSAREICETDWARQREVVVEVTDRGDGTVRVPNAPWRFSDASGVGLHGEPRYRGEDNAAVLGALLGLDEATIDALYDAGVLSSRGPGGGR